MSKNSIDEGLDDDFSVDNVDKTVHNLVFVYDPLWIKLWMKIIMSDIGPTCHFFNHS